MKYPLFKRQIMKAPHLLCVKVKLRDTVQDMWDGERGRGFQRRSDIKLLHNCQSFQIHTMIGLPSNQLRQNKENCFFCHIYIYFLHSSLLRCKNMAHLHKICKSSLLICTLSYCTPAIPDSLNTSEYILFCTQQCWTNLHVSTMP